MSQFDIAEFETRVDALMSAYKRLLEDHRALKEVYDEQQRRNRETRERLNRVIERIRALEAEAEHVHGTDEDDHGQ